MYSDRPGATFAGHVLAQGQWQLQSGPTIGSTGDFMKVNYTLFDTDIRAGLTNRLEAGVSISYQRFKSLNDAIVISGLAGVSLGMRYQLLEAEEAGRPDLVLIGSYTINGISEDFRPRLNNGSLLASLSQPISETISINLNAGFNIIAAERLQGINNGTELGLRYTANFGFALSEQLGAFAEILGQESFGLWSNAVNGGLSYRVSDLVQLDAFGGFTINTGQRNEYGSLGITVLWP